MNKDQKTGAIIFTVAVTLIAVALILSEGWNVPNVSLFLVFWKGELLDDWITVDTRYVLAALVIVVGYGAIRYFSLIPPIFRPQANTNEAQKLDGGRGP